MCVGLEERAEVILLGDIHVDVVVRQNERAVVGLEERTEERIWRGEGMYTSVSACGWRFIDGG